MITKRNKTKRKINFNTSSYEKALKTLSRGALANKSVLSDVGQTEQESSPAKADLHF
jgi:hypothetical protein